MNQIFDYAVYDRSGSKIGTVDNLWEDSSQQVTFLGISTGWLGLGRNHLVPAQDLEIDHSQQIVRVPWDEDRVKSSPSYDSSDPLNEAEETQVYQHYGLDRACATGGLSGAQESAISSGATDYATGDRNAPATGTRADRDLREGESVEIPLAEERLEVGKREKQLGEVRLRKVVRTETVNQPVELRREEVVVERVDRSGRTPGDEAFVEEVISIPVTEEEAVVRKTVESAGAVQATKVEEREASTISETVRHEDVEVERSLSESRR